MNKWIAGLLALTALSPVSAGAQMGGAWPDGGRGPRGERQVDDGQADAPRPDRGDFDGRSPDRDGPDARGPDQGGPDRAGPDRGGPDRDVPDRDRPDRNGFGRGGPDRDRPDRAPSALAPGRGGMVGDWRRGEDARRDRTGARDRGDWTGSRFDRRDDDWTRSRLDGRDDRWTQSRFGDRAGWNRGWRNDGRYDWNRYRNADRGAYRLPRYAAPGGWSGGYRRFGIGVGLQASLWSRNYWIDDPYSYRLPEAYGPYRWVRYYDDALLVDLRRGVVVDAVYGIFW